MRQPAHPAGQVIFWNHLPRVLSKILVGPWLRFYVRNNIYRYNPGWFVEDLHIWKYSNPRVSGPFRKALFFNNWATFTEQLVTRSVLLKLAAPVLRNYRDIKQQVYLKS